MHQVIVQHRLQSEVATEHQVTVATISTLCKRAQKNQNFLQELMTQRDQKATRHQVIAETIVEMNQLNVFVDSAREVRKALMDTTGADVKEPEIRSIMKEDLGMRYRKLVPVSIHGNSQKNLVLRQQFAMKLIGLLLEGKRLLNVDETWLGMTDFRRRKWRAPGTTNSVAQLNMVPRVSMIMGIDTAGMVYISLLQANSNGQVMEIFFR